MQKLKDLNKRRLVTALAGGVVAQGLYKLYLYNNDRGQFEDSNLLVAAVFIFLAAFIIFLILGLIANRSSSK